MIVMDMRMNAVVQKMIGVHLLLVHILIGAFFLLLLNNNFVADVVVGAVDMDTLMTWTSSTMVMVTVGCEGVDVNITNTQRIFVETVVDGAVGVNVHHEPLFCGR